MKEGQLTLKRLGIIWHVQKSLDEALRERKRDGGLEAEKSVVYKESSSGGSVLSSFSRNPGGLGLENVSSLSGSHFQQWHSCDMCHQKLEYTDCN